MKPRIKTTGISGGILLIGIGILLIFNWFWPGILLVIGFADGTDNIYSGRTGEGIRKILLFTGATVLVMLIQHTHLSWRFTGSLVLMAVGIFMLIKAIPSKTGGQKQVETENGEGS